MTDSTNGKGEGRCQFCGQPMPLGEEMFNYHGFSGPCPPCPTCGDTNQNSNETLSKLCPDLWHISNRKAAAPDQSPAETHSMYTETQVRLILISKLTLAGNRIYDAPNGPRLEAIRPLENLVDDIRSGKENLE